MWIRGFHRHEHLYNYGRHKFQNVLEIRLCGYFGQLLQLLKNVEPLIGHAVDSAYGVYIHYRHS